MPVKIFVLSFTLMLFSTALYADSWYFDKGVSERKYEFGNTLITLEIDATRNQKYPVYTLDVVTDDKLQARYRNVAFEQVFASRDNSVFVGLSNDGLPGTAIVVFDKEGNLRLEIKHQFANLDYCSKGVIRERLWYDTVKPDFEFRFDEQSKSLLNMFVNDCHGKRISLFELIDNIYNKNLNGS